MKRTNWFATVGALALMTMVFTPAVQARGIDALALVPSDAASVGVIRLSELRSGTITSRLLFETDKAAVDGEAERFLREAGLRPRLDVDTVVVSMSPSEPHNSNGSILVAFEGRFNVEKLSAAMAQRGAERVTGANGTYFRVPHDPGRREDAVIAFVNQSLALAGSEAAVMEALARRGSANRFSSTGLGRQFHRVDSDATAWLLVDVPRFASLESGRKWEEGERGQMIAGAIRNVDILALWSSDNGSAVNVGGVAVSKDAETRDLLEDALRGAVAAWRMAAQEKTPELVPVLRRFKIGQSRDGVTFEGSLPAELLEKRKIAAK